jgi:hypothetical protein
LKNLKDPLFFKPKDPSVVQTTLMPSFLQQLKQHEAAAMLNQQQLEAENIEEKKSRMRIEGGSSRKKSKKGVTRKTKKTKKTKKPIKKMNQRKGRKTKKQRK